MSQTTKKKGREIGKEKEREKVVLKILNIEFYPLPRLGPNDEKKKKLDSLWFEYGSGLFPLFLLLFISNSQRNFFLG